MSILYPISQLEELLINSGVNTVPEYIDQEFQAKPATLAPYARQAGSIDAWLTKEN